VAGSFSQAVKTVVKMEPPSPETSWASDPEEPGWWAASTSPDHPGGDAGTSWQAAAGPLPGENAFQGLPDESWAPIIRSDFWEEISANTKPSSARLFLQKLWKIVGSHHFQSIWWGDDGNCVVIAEKLFRKEVLGRRGPLKIFETESMRGFILQLNLHGFCRMEGDALVSASIEELQAVAAAGSALGKLLFYYNPFFQRDYPNLLRMCTQGAGERKRAPAASPLGPKVKKDHLRRRRPGAQPAVGA
ncbi:Heat shock transcription factor, Y-linked, partial [Spheniscus demersus]